MTTLVVLTVIDIALLIAGLAIYLYIVGGQLTRVADKLEECADGGQSIGISRGHGVHAAHEGAVVEDHLHLHGVLLSINGVLSALAVRGSPVEVCVAEGIPRYEEFYFNNILD